MRTVLIKDEFVINVIVSSPEHNDKIRKKYDFVFEIDKTLLVNPGDKFTDGVFERDPCAMMDYENMKVVRDPVKTKEKIDLRENKIQEKLKRQEQENIKKAQTRERLEKSLGKEVLEDLFSILPRG